MPPSGPLLPSTVRHAYVNERYWWTQRHTTLMDWTICSTWFPPFSGSEVVSTQQVLLRFNGLITPETVSAPHLHYQPLSDVSPLPNMLPRLYYHSLFIPPSTYSSLCCSHSVCLLWNDRAREIAARQIVYISTASARETVRGEEKDIWNFISIVACCWAWSVTDRMKWRGKK